MTCLGICYFCLLCTCVRTQGRSSWQYPDAAWRDGFAPVSDAPKFQSGNWKIHSNQDLLSVLLPVVPKHLELGYMKNQLRTFDKYFDLASLGAWVVVTPHEHLLSMQHFFRHQLHKDVPGINPHLFKVVEDGQCASELLPDSPYQDLTLWPGWTRQQVVKLACANLMQTPFYLVLDADVFMARHASVLDLLVTQDCRAELHHVCNEEQQVAYRCKNDCYPMLGEQEDWHMRWWRNSAQTLQLNVTFDWEYAIGVTPQILATDISLQLGKYIVNRFHVDSWVAYLLDVFADRNHRQWEASHELQHDPAWTEYSLYYLFAQHAGVFEMYHASAPVLQASAVWTWEQYEQWDPCRDTFNSSSGVLSLVQSNLKVPAETIWNKMQLCWKTESKLL